MDRIFVVVEFDSEEFMGKDELQVHHNITSIGGTPVGWLYGHSDDILDGMLTLNKFQTPIVINGTVVLGVRSFDPETFVFELEMADGTIQESPAPLRTMPHLYGALMAMYHKHMDAKRADEYDKGWDIGSDFARFYRDTGARQEFNKSSLMDLAQNIANTRGYSKDQNPEALAFVNGFVDAMIEYTKRELEDQMDEAYLEGKRQGDLLTQVGEIDRERPVLSSQQLATKIAMVMPYQNAEVIASFIRGFRNAAVQRVAADKLAL